MDTCNTDYVLIPEGYPAGSSVLDRVTSDRFCGDKFLRPGLTNANNVFLTPNVGAVVCECTPKKSCP